MCRLQPITVPEIAHPTDGPWRLRSTRPNGETHLSTHNYRRHVDAQHDADACNRVCREGCAYDVIPDPGGARWTVG